MMCTEASRSVAHPWGSSLAVQSLESAARGAVDRGHAIPFAHDPNRFLLGQHDSELTVVKASPPPPPLPRDSLVLFHLSQRFACGLESSGRRMPRTTCHTCRITCTMRIERTTQRAQTDAAGLWRWSQAPQAPSSLAELSGSHRQMRHLAPFLKCLEGELNGQTI